jgi:hypothetical protein
MGRVVYATRCKLDTTTLIVPAYGDEIAELISTYPGVRPFGSGRALRPRHLWFEFSLVHSGGPDFENLQTASRAIGGNPLGWWWRVAVEPWFSVANAAFSRVGAYHEVMMGVPDVSLEGLPDGPVTLVLGMYTDSPVAKWGDDALRSGYGKRLTRIERRGFDEFAVFRGDGRALLRTHGEPGARSEDAANGARAPAEDAQRWWSQPLLGYLGNGEYALSHLTRSLGPDSVMRATPATFGVVMDAAFGLKAATYQASAPRDGDVGAFQVSNLNARLSYPKQIRL